MNQANDRKGKCEGSVFWEVDKCADQNNNKTMRVLDHIKDK